MTQRVYNESKDNKMDSWASDEEGAESSDEDGEAGQEEVFFRGGETVAGGEDGVGGCEEVGEGGEDEEVDEDVDECDEG